VLGACSGLFMLGCVSLAPDMNAWTGHSSDELIVAWGEPDLVEEMGMDNYAYTWVDDDDVCRRTFMARAGKITGYSEFDCRH
jgi:hypothetical protein